MCSCSLLNSNMSQHRQSLNLIEAGGVQFAYADVNAGTHRGSAVRPSSGCISYAIYPSVANARAFDIKTVGWLSGGISDILINWMAYKRVGAVCPEVNWTDLPRLLKRYEMMINWDCTNVVCLVCPAGNKSAGTHRLHHRQRGCVQRKERTCKAHVQEEKWYSSVVASRYGCRGRCCFNNCCVTLFRVLLKTQ